MYKVYLKTFNERGFSEVESATRTTTASMHVAATAFKEILDRKRLWGKKAHAVLSCNNKQVLYHRFDRSPGERDYVEADSVEDVLYLMNLE